MDGRKGEKEREEEAGRVGWNPNSATKSVALAKLINSKKLKFLVWKVVKTILTTQGYCTRERRQWDTFPSTAPGI